MATIAANVIFLWTGTIALIPAGWSRETNLDAVYPKGTPDSTDPGGTGGALTHSHTTPNHTHTAAHVHTIPNESGESGSSARDVNTTNPPAVHTHVSNPSTVDPLTSLSNDTPATSTVNHEPAYKEVIFIKSDGTPTGLADGIVGLWNNAAGAPASWNLCDGAGGRPDMRLKFAKGAAAASEIGADGGAATHEHSITSHSHTGAYGHTHPNTVSSPTATANTAGDISGAKVAVANSAHTHTLALTTYPPVVTANTDAAAADNHEPPYWLLAWIQNNAGALSWPDRIIGLWLGTLALIPANWKLCDGTLGTPDIMGLFIKGANTLAGIGGSGGSLTHGSDHTCTGHTHPVAAHTHAITDQADAANTARTAGAVAAATAAHTHTWGNTGSTGFTSGSGTPVPADYTDTQPPYKNVAFIEWHEPAAGVSKPILANYYRHLRIED